MLGVAKSHDAGTVCREFQILHRMTAGAVFDAEGLLSVMTCAAGFALIHFSHGDSFVGTGGKQGRMTGVAVGNGRNVFFMAEMRRTGSLDREGDLLDLVATGTFL